MSSENKTIKNKISILFNYYNIKNYDKLIEEANRLLKKNPNIDILWNMLGLTYQQLGEFNKAEKNFLKTLQINPVNISAVNNLGNNYKYLDDFQNAEKYFQLALKGNANYIPALINYGNLKFEFNKCEEAINFFNKALIIDKKIPLIHLNLALVYQSLGSFEKSIQHLEEINKLEPKFTRSDKMLSGLINYNTNDKHLLVMEEKLKNLQLNDNNKIELYFAISKAHEDKSNYATALKFFEYGNELKRSKSNYNIDKDKKLFSSIKSLFNDYKVLAPKNKKLNKTYKNIIFILGMPRSGTTLVEQIVSSHKDVYGAGELNYLNKLIHRNFFSNNNIDLIDSLISLNEINAKRISDAYQKYIENFDFKQNYIVDKALLNFKWIGFIKILFPNAKIINCTRNPADNCLSIYKNLFDHEGPWSYNKNELTQFYSLYSDLMKFWKEKFPDSIYDVKYEELVKNPNSQVKELLTYLNIGWDDNCLKFYENKSAIKTLSVNQARKRIYTSSVSSYDRYKPLLKDSFLYFE